MPGLERGPGPPAPRPLQRARQAPVLSSTSTERGVGRAQAGGSAQDPPYLPSVPRAAAALPPFARCLNAADIERTAAMTAADPLRYGVLLETSLLRPPGKRETETEELWWLQRHPVGAGPRERVGPGRGRGRQSWGTPWSLGSSWGMLLSCLFFFEL